MLDGIAHVATEVFTGIVLLGAGAGLAIWRARTRRIKAVEAAEESAALQRAQTFDQIEELFRGHGENPLTGDEAEPGLVKQLQTLRKRQEEIATTAAQAAVDAKAIRVELTRNGGSTTKDAAFEASRAAEAAAAAAELASRSASRTELLLRRHLVNLLEISEVSRHNDSQIQAAIEALGGTVVDIRPFPPVDIGKDVQGP